MKDRKLRKLVGYNDGDEQFEYSIKLRLRRVESILSELLKNLGYETREFVRSCGCCWDIQLNDVHRSSLDRIRKNRSKS